MSMWTVDEYCDKITERSEQEAISLARYTHREAYPNRFVSEGEAFAFIIQRAKQKLAAAREGRKEGS